MPTEADAYAVASPTLLAACSREDRRAWEALYRQGFPIAYGVAVRAPFKLGAEDARDVAQQVMIEVTANIRKGQRPSRLPGYLQACSHNRCVDLMRRRDPVRESVALKPEHEINLTHVATADTDTGYLIEVLHARLARLGQPCEDLLRKRFFERKRYRAIAGELDLPANQVGVYLERCLTRIKRALELDDPEIWQRSWEALK